MAPIVYKSHVLFFFLQVNKCFETGINYLPAGMNIAPTAICIEIVSVTCRNKHQINWYGDSVGLWNIPAGMVITPTGTEIVSVSV